MGALDSRFIMRKFLGRRTKSTYFNLIYTMWKIKLFMSLTEQHTLSDFRI